MVQRFRWPVLILAGVCVFLTGASIFFTFSAYSDYRSADFTKASAGPTTGSCVSYIKNSQLELANYHKTDWSCGDNSKKDLANLLSASVHAAHAVQGFTGDAERAYLTLISLAQGGTGHELSRAQAYDLLSKINTVDPTKLTCEQIYPGATLDAAEPNQIDPTIKCDADGEPADATSGINATSTLTDASNVNALYTHCVHQFTYGFSFPTTGTFGIPKQGVEAKPMLFPLVETNATTSKFKKAQVLVGTRWGYATIVYVFFCLPSAFFLMDSMILILAELTRVDACVHCTLELEHVAYVSFNFIALPPNVSI